MARIEKTIFISYRRKDISWALAVYQYLTHRRYDVFFDITNLAAGDFERVIVSNIKARAHFVLILTPDALERCDEPGDWLRREIETAMDENRNIIPLLFNGFSFSSSSVIAKLTGKLEDLDRFHGLEVPSGYFIEAMDRLRKRYLNVPQDAVIHAIPTRVREVVKIEQVAAAKALEQERDVIEQIIAPAGGSNIWRTLGGVIGIFLLVAILGLSGVYAWNNWGVITQTPTPRPFSHPFTPPAEKTPPPTKDGMTLVFIPGGSFTMGSEDGSENERPLETIYVSYFWIDQTEVTNAMYAKCVDDDGCDPPYSLASASRMNYYEDAVYADYPVIQVSWYNAKAYCEWAGRRLPTEAEWEKVARGTDERDYPWGNVIDRSYTNYNGSEGDTTEVKHYERGISPYGVYDMAGNVSEWVSSLYRPYPYRVTDGREDLEVSGNRVVRGGSWYGQGIGGDFVRTTYRSWFNPTVVNNFTGFRCAMDAFE